MTSRYFATARRVRGSALVMAIFLLVVLAALGVALVGISSTQHTSSALDVVGVRAYQAARAGAEWGIYRQRIGGSCVPTTSFALPAGTSLASFTVTVSCTETTPNGINRYRVIATACNQPAGGVCPNAGAASADYVQRVIDVRFGD